ncbi:MAG: hypothetical protein Kow0069_23330 [Promethearchaeota archaeon]
MTTKTHRSSKQAVERVLNRVLEWIVPTPRERELVNEAFEKVKEVVVKVAASKGLDLAFVELGGSTGMKQTQLRNASDLDVFVGIPPESVLGPRSEWPRDRASQKKRARPFLSSLVKQWLLPALHKLGVQNAILSYAEHPYVKGKFGGLEVDVVPCFDLSKEEIGREGPITAVDRTPWHSRHVRDSLDEDAKNRARLLKQFCKAQHSYGDKSAPGRTGFVGYALELLAAQFGDLYSLFEQFDSLRKVAFDPLGRSADELRSQPRFSNDVLLVIDPVDPRRNVAASTSERSFLHVAARVGEFLAAPSEEFFRIEPIPLAARNHFPGEFAIVEFDADPKFHYTIPRDKLYALGQQVVRTAKTIDGGETRFDGVVFEEFFDAKLHRHALAFYYPGGPLSSTYVRKGPRHDRNGVSKFREKHPHAYLDGECWVVEARRSFTRFSDFLADAVNRWAPKQYEYLKLAGPVFPVPDDETPVVDSRGLPSPVGWMTLTALKDMVLPHISLSNGQHSTSGLHPRA